uniref:Uncharacterized protein n=1 Tax=Trichobilharzia regenti TaxID=157069 RepID=A0AA85IXF8_TRIRE|nr:unnamed protein product [Trichobilharzia regenti]
MLVLPSRNAKYDLNSTLEAYADSYHQVLNNKFFMIELQTYVDPQNAEETMKTEILRLEHLYQSKWAKDFLESIDAEDKELVNLYNDKYRKALEEDSAFQHKGFAHEELYNLLKTSISRKWENRKNLDIAEAKLFAETSGNLKKDKVQIEMMKKDLMEVEKAVNIIKADLQGLRTAAVIASNEYRNTLNALNNAETPTAYETARSDFADGKEELRDMIKLLEMKRIEFLKFQTPEFRTYWILAEMKEDAEQYY